MHRRFFLFIEGAIMTSSILVHIKPSFQIRAWLDQNAAAAFADLQSARDHANYSSVIVTEALPQYVYMVREVDGDRVFDVNGPVHEHPWTQKKLKEARRQQWLAEFDSWCQKHSLTREQGVNVLMDPSWRGLLCGWVESNDFLLRTAAEIKSAENGHSATVHVLRSCAS
jgi:hypothetical protein